MGSMDLDQIVADAQKAFAEASDVTTLENEKARFLGKSGALTELLKGLGKLDPETRKTEGARINLVKQQVEAALTDTWWDHVIVTGSDVKMAAVKSLALSDALAAVDSKFWGFYRVARAAHALTTRAATCVSR